MQSTSSVAQGTFLFLPDGFSLAKLRNTRKGNLEEKTDFMWEIAFNKIWQSVNQEIKEINEKLFSKVLQDVMEHLKKLHNDVMLSDGVIPCEILLTGTNLPDHKLLLSTFIHNLNKQITPYVASLWSWNCGNIKSTVQNFVSQIIPISKKRKKNPNDDDDNDDDENDDDDDDGDDDDDEGEMSVNEDSLLDNNPDESYNIDVSPSKIHFQISQYNFSTLSSWYDVQCKGGTAKKPVIIIIPDFESFSPVVLGEFILLLSAYGSKIPFILVFGVATTPAAVYQNLSRNVLSQLATQLFKSEPSTTLLNNVIENVLFSERCPFRLGKKCMTFLTDIFLFHSFSVHSFIQGFKYCLIEHFYKRNHFALCGPLENVSSQADELSEEDVESIRKLESFQKFVEGCQKEDRKALLLNDNHTRKTIGKMVKDVLDHTRVFHVALKILYILTSDLPKAPFGRNLREYYCKSVSDRIRETEEYQDCIKLLELQSQNEMITKIDNLIELMKSVRLTSSYGKKDKKLKDFLTKLERFKDSFQNLTSEPSSEVAETEGKNGYEVLRKNFLDHVKGEILKEWLSPPCELPLHEVIYFDDLTAIRRRISGSPRGAIHLALNNPQCYLNCKCCVLSNTEEIVPTLPDLSIVYKIHLECNKMINMYDWLQSFVSIVKQESSEEQEGDVDKQIQARFTRAVSELQLLGFIKPSRSKTDHVSRLTWGNS